MSTPLYQLRRRLRWATILLGFALLVVLSRTAILPRLVFAERAAVERALSMREPRGVHDKIRNAKKPVQTGKCRHLAFAPLDLDDDADDDSDDDCLGVDETALPSVGSLVIADAYAGSRQRMANSPQLPVLPAAYRPFGARAPPAHAS